MSVGDINNLMQRPYIMCSWLIPLRDGLTGLWAKRPSVGKLYMPVGDVNNLMQRPYICRKTLQMGCRKTLQL